MRLDPQQVPTTLMQPAMDAGQPTAPSPVFTGLTIEYDRMHGHPRTVILNRDDTRTEHYTITDDSGAGLGQDVRYFELGSRIVSEPRCAPPDPETLAALRAAAADWTPTGGRA
jgi:hypothetical protein